MYFWYHRMQFVLHSVSTARIILHLRMTSSQPGSNDGSALLSDEYMKKRIVFRSPESSGDTGQDSDFIPIELDTRGFSEDVRREEEKKHLVVNPYMI